MKGGIRRPRPCTFAARQPPIVSLSAPVCFCPKVHCCSRPFCTVARCCRTCGHWIPASTSRWPFSKSRPSTRFMRRVSMRRPSYRNCCPPMAWRAPAMQMARSSFCAARIAARIASSDSGCTMRQTRAELSCEWTSLTRIPGGGLSFFFAAACGSALDGQANAASFRKSLRRIRLGLLRAADHVRKIHLFELHRRLVGGCDLRFHVRRFLGRGLERLGEPEAERGERLRVRLLRLRGGERAVDPARKRDEDALGEIDVGVLGGCAHDRSGLTTAILR